MSGFGWVALWQSKQTRVNTASPSATSASTSSAIPGGKAEADCGGKDHTSDQGHRRDPLFAVRFRRSVCATLMVPSPRKSEISRGSPTGRQRQTAALWLPRISLSVYPAIRPADGTGHAGEDGTWLHCFRGLDDRLRRGLEREPELGDALAKIGFNSVIGYGMQGEDAPRGYIDVQNGQVVASGAYDGQDLNWDLRAPRPIGTNGATRASA